MKLLILAIMIMATTHASAKTYKLRWMINDELEYFIEASKEFKTKVEQRTQGRVQVEIVPFKASQESHDHLGDILQGKAEMGQELIYKLQAYAPGLEVWDIPYLFSSDAQIERYISSQMAKDDLVELSKSSITALGYSFSGGFIYYFGSSAFQSLEELRGRKLSMEPASEKYKTYLKNHYDISPVSVEKEDGEFSEIIAGVGEELLARSDSHKLSVIQSSHRVISRIIVISDKFLNALPDDLREVVVFEGEAAAKRERAITNNRRDKFLKSAQKQKMKIIKPSSNLKMQSEYLKSLDKSITARVKKINEL